MTRRILLKTVFAALCLAGAAAAFAHSGKARFHLIVDTDAAADDLRAISMLLGNREAEILAVTTSEGGLTPAQGAVRVRALLDGFHHEGIPVGEGRPAGAPAPAWRALSEGIEWGDTTAVRGGFRPAAELIPATLENEEEKVVFFALGTLTNLSDVLRERPELASRIDRVIWYSDVDPLSGPNYETDSLAAQHVLASGLPVQIVAANVESPVPLNAAYLDSVALVPTAYARKIVDTHRSEPLASVVESGHLETWDEQAVLYLFRPELFDCRPIGGQVRACLLPAGTSDKALSGMMEILRGKPDTESRVFYGFPTGHALYAADVVPIIDSAIMLYGPSEWRAGVLTNELHGHLGIYAIIGVKMGIRAREYFNIGVDDIEVVSSAGCKPPVSCMNDGLQVGTGATVGHGLIRVPVTEHPQPEASFTFKDRTIRLRLKPEYARRIRDDVRRGIELYGDLTEPYWQYVRELALGYWLDFDRNEIFELQVVE